MVPGGVHGGNVGLAATKAPPPRGPSMENAYSFRSWARDISLWSLVTDLTQQKQAVAVVMQLKGVARALAANLDHEVLTRGGRLEVE
eukprot:1183456-Lingulodinium_polyedra.AAC.1